MITLQNENSNVAKVLQLAKYKTMVFDLDGVVVDARHRQILNSDGSLDIANYKANSTAEKIARDVELPFLEVMREMTKRKQVFHICTAREFCENTANWLRSRGADFSLALGRPSGSAERDFILKKNHFEKTLLSNTPSKGLMFIDDNIKNVETILGLSVPTIHVPFDGH